ncbi:acyltransferase family protein [Microbacterium rhizophilus]|uniref:acyltransferase family protein n=1 Tax=Microbacterium rhizophilus TaxID=3138934 RepID=UPI0031ED77D2
MERTKQAVPAGRDLTLDLARVGCVLLVVVVHVLFTGVGRAADGSLLIERTVEAQDWFDAASWVANIMPLFFVVGGFAARVGWRSTVARGGDADGFARLRLARLARPAVPVLLFFTIALGAVRAIGLDPALVETVAVGVGSPLWFLAAYATVQALAPWMIRWHERSPWVTLVVLLAGALVVDIVRLVVGIYTLGLDRIGGDGYDFGHEFFGIPNVLFVWLFAQQLGFALADGWFARRTRWELTVLVAAGYGAVWALVFFGDYSWNMLANQWPPTAPLALLAVVQAAAFTLLRPVLEAVMRTRVAQRALFLLGSRLMTIYLWHLPVIMILIGVQLLLPLPMPAPGGAAWWWTRVPFALLVLAVVCLLSLWLARYERIPEGGEPRVPGRTATVVAVVLFIVPPLGISAYGLDFPLALAGLIGAVAALRLTGPRRHVPAPTSAGSHQAGERPEGARRSP